MKPATSVCLAGYRVLICLQDADACVVMDADPTLKERAYATRGRAPAICQP
jgi:hypothetical protein